MNRRLIRLLLASAAVALAVGVACSDDEGDDDTADTPVAEASVAATSSPATPGAPTPAATAGDAATPAEGAQEVVGIVGAVNQAENRIEINRLSGADVTVVLVTPATEILSAQGRTLPLSALRASDRIIAAGEIAEGEMTADRVEIQPVRPGASPGG
jgi:hypothetical protein